MGTWPRTVSTPPTGEEWVPGLGQYLTPGDEWVPGLRRYLPLLQGMNVYLAYDSISPLLQEMNGYLVQDSIYPKEMNGYLA